MQTTPTSSAPQPSHKSDRLECNYTCEVWGKMFDIWLKHMHRMFELLIVAQRTVRKEFN